MARVTVEDCVEKLPNRFELVALAAQRAREISAGAPLLLDRDNDKNPVVALREIAEDKVEPEELKESLIQSFQLYSASDEPMDDIADLPMETAPQAPSDEAADEDASDEDDDGEAVAAAGEMGSGVMFEDITREDIDAQAVKTEEA